MSFMSFKSAAPLCQQFIHICTYTKPNNQPFENCIVFQKFIEVVHQFVDRFAHVKMADNCPNAIRVGQEGSLVLIGAKRRLELVSTFIDIRVLERWRDGFYKRVFRSILNVEEVIGHGLVREFVEKRRYQVQ
jgi:hypothetical protein